MTELPSEQTWMILVDLLSDLKKKGVETPRGLNRDIQLAKSSINFCKINPADPERMKATKEINDLLNSTQDVLLTLADDISQEYVESWVEKLKKASTGEKLYKIPDKKPRFIVGAPSGFSRARLTFKKPILEERLVDIAEYHNVIIEFEEDNVIVLYGDKENIQKSLKELSTFFSEQIEDEE
jgi:hypothetical protein